MSQRWDGIYFLKSDGSIFAFRGWEIVPRIGDEVVFAPDDIPRKVRRVLWRETKSGPMREYVEVYFEDNPT